MLMFADSHLLALTTPPTEEPVTLADAKQYLRVEHEEDDTLIEDLIIAARQKAEHWLKRALITQSWKIAVDDYVPESVSLPMGPVTSITSITIINSDNTTQLISNTSYRLNAAKNCVLFDSPLFGFRIEIIYVSGFGNAASVPKSIKQGLLSHIAALYDNRGEYQDGQIPAQAITLYSAYREVRV